MAEETNKEGTTTGNGYLTKPYLVRNLQTFWGNIKQYIANQISGFVSKDYVDGAVGNKADKTALDTLTTTVNGKADSSTLTALETDLTEKLAGKVNVESGMGLSENDFTDVLKSKLENLKDSAATHSEMGFMSSDDKQNLDRLVENAVTEVDDALSETSTNPVQNNVINEALAKKVDKENPLDFSGISNHLSCTGNSNGDIILTLHDSTKHFKIHAETGETIEKFYVSRKDSADQEINFNTFGGDGRIVTIPNPDGNGVLTENQIYKFYVECFELLGAGKYEPFILQVKRGGADPEELSPSIF